MEFKESYFITSDGARIFYRYRLAADVACENPSAGERSEEHTSELQSR